MRFTDDIIEEVRSKNDIVDVISQYVKLTRRGSSHFGLCPFHNEKSPSFSVSQGKQMYYCFGCGAGGNVFTFLMEYENYTFTEAMEHLADRAGVALPKMEYSKEAKAQADRRAVLLEINKQAAKYYYVCLRGERGGPAMAYLKERALSGETMRKFGLGYADKYSDDLYRYLKTKGYSDELLIESGLFLADEKRGVHDKFWNRVMFPIMDVNHRVVGFGGRVMGEGKPKYLNSPETKIFDKSRNLYGLNLARTTRKPYLILCEGYMDVITMHQAGFTNAVASLGTALTPGHAKLISRYAKEVLLLYDSDEAGVRAALRGIPILKDAGVSSRVVSLKPYKDPDEFLKAKGAEAFENRLKKAKNSFLFEMEVLQNRYDMEDPQGKTGFFQEAARRLLEFPEELERNNYIEVLAKTYGVSPGDLRKMVNKRALEGYSPPERTKAGNEPREKPKRTRESPGEQAQKLLLTWLVTYPEIFPLAAQFVTPEDFTRDLYRQVAALLYRQYEEGEVNPAKLLNQFTDSEEQREVAGMFNAALHLETKKERERAFRDAILCIRTEHQAEENAKTDSRDLLSLQKGMKKKKELEELRAKLEQVTLSFRESAPGRG